MIEQEKGLSVQKLTLSAMFLALGLVLPFLTGQVPQIGKMLLPMHIPVLLCGLICGRRYGGIIGFILPLLRSMIFGMPKMPNAISMAFELAAYGFIIGWMYGAVRRKSIKTLYLSMITAMLAGRIVWAVAQVFLLGLGDNGFTFQMFIAGAFVNALPGIVVQLVLIPAIMVALHQTGYVRFDEAETYSNYKGAIR